VKGLRMGLDGLVNTGKDLAGKAKDVAGDLTGKGKDVAGGLIVKAKDVGGRLVEYAKEVTGIAKGEGSIRDKARAALDAVRKPGAPDSR